MYSNQKQGLNNQQNSDRIMEVTIKQLTSVINQNSEENWKIDDQFFDKIVIAGQCIDVQQKQNRSFFYIDDSTDDQVMEVQVYQKDSEDLHNLMKLLNYRPYMYVRVVLQPKVYKNKVILLSDNIKEISFSDFIFHSYQVILQHNIRINGFKQTLKDINFNDNTSAKPSKNLQITQIESILKDKEIEDVQKVFECIKVLRDNNGGGLIKKKLVEQELSQHFNLQKIHICLNDLEDSGYINFDNDDICCLA